MARPSDRRAPPPKRSVRDRWFLPPKTQFVSIPFPIAHGVLMDLGVEDLRVMLWIIGDWWWPGGLQRELNAEIVARRTKMTRQNVRRSLASLSSRGLIEVFSRGKGRSPVVSIEPLIKLGRAAASREDSARVYFGKRRSKKTQGESTKTQGESTGRLNGEPGEGTSEPFPSDEVRRTSEVGAGSSVLSNGHGERNGRDRKAEERLRLEQAQEYLAKCNREEAEMKSRLEAAP